MNRINYGRVVLGGVVAGLIINLIEFVVNAFVLKEQWAAAMSAIGKSGEYGTPAIIAFNIWGFVMGFLAVWTYAGFRPRFGPGPRTAALAAITLWIAGYLLSMIPPAVLGIFPGSLMVTATIIGLIEIIVATEAGAAVYTEPAAA